MVSHYEWMKHNNFVAPVAARPYEWVEPTVLQTCLWRAISYGVWGLKSDFGDQGPFAHNPSNSRL